MHWQTLSWPFRPTPLFAVVAFLLVAVAFTAWASMNFWAGVLVVTMGSPVWYAVLGGLSIYSRKMLTQAAQGLFDERIDNETEINPFHGGNALQLCLTHLAVFVFFYYSGPELGPWMILPALVLPLIWTGIMLDDAPFSYLQPARAGQLIGGLGPYYLLAVALISGSLGYLHYALQYADGNLNLLLSPFAFLFANLIYGVILYHRRHELDLTTMKSPEQALAEELAVEQKRIDRLFHDVHTHMNAGNHVHAIRLIEEEVSQDPTNLDPLMHERLQEFRNEQLLLEHAVRYLGRLIERGESRKAWALMKECLEREPRFRPPEDEALFQLTRSAGRDDAGIVNTLLADFPEAYPESALIPDALFRRARICIELLGDGETGIGLLRQIARDHPAFARSEAFRRYQERLKPV